ncbi:MAG TPA: hypothetical protein VES40_04960 [Ilumatobacteraceae bacterium]|nr:hypothetical protein [Ilumatobacteraceae bacterium]
MTASQGSPLPPSGDVIDLIDLADGRVMTVRSMTADDGERISELYRDLTMTDRHRRFFGAFSPQLDWCRKWASVGERGGFGVIVLVGDGDDAVVVAEAGYAMRADGDGDLAITVATPWRGWLGAYLLDLLVRRAATEGVRNLQAEVLLENGPMLSLLRRWDAVAVEHDDGMVRVSIGTSGATPDWPPGETRPRVLVEVAGRRWSGEHAAEDAGLATTICAGPGRRVRHGCPVLEGGTCPLADGADAIVVLLDPADERSHQLIEAHRRTNPGTPVLVRHRVADADAAPSGCVELDDDGARAVAQLVSLIGHR